MVESLPTEIKEIPFISKGNETIIPIVSHVNGITSFNRQLIKSDSATLCIPKLMNFEIP